MKKSKVLGMSHSTANYRLVKDLLWKYVQNSQDKDCYRCKLPMTREDFSIDHKQDWLNSDNPVELFFDLENIKFSHLECNAAASSSRIKSPCGTDRKYRNGCRCEDCKAAHSVSSKKYYRKELRQARYLRTGK